MKYLLLITTICFVACTQNNSNSTPLTLLDSINAASIFKKEKDTVINNDYQDKAFDNIHEYPTILDTTAFIKALQQYCHIYVSDMIHLTPSINYFKKIKIYGSNKDFYMIEYDYKDGSNAGFPWKKQLLFDTTGKLLQVFKAMKLEPIKIFTNKTPFLIGVFATGHGNGWHQIYQINADTIKQIYDGFPSNRPQTYDSNDDIAINQPFEFPYHIADVNHDGYNDIYFTGKVRYSKIDLGVEDKIVPVKYIFLYNKATGHFTEKEDYSKKYEFIYGDTN